MKKLLALLAILWCAPAAAQGYINPPIYATGYIYVKPGVTVTTQVYNAVNPNNLNVFASGAITTWNINLPVPPFDGQIISIGCPGGSVGTINVSAAGSSVGGGGLTACTTGTGTLTQYQYNFSLNTWLNISNSINPLAATNTWTGVQTFTAPILANAGAVVDSSAQNIAGASWATINGLFPSLSSGSAAAWAWNYSNGLDESDLLLGKGSGVQGGVNLYDFPTTSGALAPIASLNSTASAFYEPVTLSPSGAAPSLTLNAPSSSYAANQFLAVAGTNKWQIGEASGADPYYSIYNSGMSQQALKIDASTDAVTTAGSLSSATWGAGVAASFVNSVNTASGLLTYGAATLTSVATPAGPGSTSVYTMGGLGASITPSSTGRVLVSVSGTFDNNADTTASDGMTFYIAYGTGAAPINGAAVTGTQVGQRVVTTAPVTVAASELLIPVSRTELITGLTKGTTYWIDIAQQAVNATGYTLNLVDVTATEE